MRRAHSGFRERPLLGIELPRRRFLGQSLLGMGALVAPGLIGCSERSAEGKRPKRSNFAKIGPLGPPDANGVRLAEGFSARIVARAGQRPLESSEFLWHGAPDGGATYPAPDGGWIYVSNSESIGTGGASALCFDAEARVTAAYRILEGTNINCAGGPTPWGTWLSCEEHGSGRVHECDPFGKEPAIARPALGAFKHEAAAVDPRHQHVYLTEDESDGRFYRFVPANLTRGGYADLSSGRLEVAVVAEDGSVTWAGVPAPAPEGSATPTRAQVPGSTPFRGGEGVWYHAGVVYFTTKGDNRVWAYHVARSTLGVFYDAATNPDPILTGVDNVTVSVAGDVLVAEDGGDMQIVALLPDGTLRAIAQVTGQEGSEITGPAFSPAGNRLYFSSQRSEVGNGFGSGITYEVTGPFLV
ncbi:MAG TPA: alkaline phosphatase PhoX [Polyangiaceae bacterium]|nr:alkaline phosphatase PhoX [Polyangiaceae bacterium]